MKGKKIKKLKTAVLGCTGLVGQQFVRMLDGHPFFELTFLTASKSSVGKEYNETVDWSIGGDIPDNDPLFQKPLRYRFGVVPLQF